MKFFFLLPPSLLSPSILLWNTYSDVISVNPSMMDEWTDYCSRSRLPFYIFFPSPSWLAAAEEIPMSNLSGLNSMLFWRARFSGRGEKMKRVNCAATTLFIHGQLLVTTARRRAGRKWAVAAAMDWKKGKLKRKEECFYSAGNWLQFPFWWPSYAYICFAIGPSAKWKREGKINVIRGANLK